MYSVINSIYRTLNKPTFNRSWMVVKKSFIVCFESINMMYFIAFRSHKPAEIFLLHLKAIILVTQWFITQNIIMVYQTHIGPLNQATLKPIIHIEYASSNNRLPQFSLEKGIVRNLDLIIRWHRLALKQWALSIILLTFTAPTYEP